MMSKIINQDILLEYVSAKGLNQQFQKFFQTFKVPIREKIFNLTYMTLESLCKKLNRRQQGDEQKMFKKRKVEWKRGQYKLFLWVSGFYLYNQQVKPFEMNSQDFQFIKSIFLKKTTERIKYQLSYLCCQQKKNWCYSQIALFKSIVQTESKLSETLEWKKIAYKLYATSKGTYFKTFVHCREMWYNHLNPNVNKKNWTVKEDAYLLTLVSQLNKSWSTIAQKFHGQRTVHMVKNRYNSLIGKNKRKQQKFEQQELLKTKIQEQQSNQKEQCFKSLEQIIQVEPTIKQNSIDEEFQRIRLENELFLFERQQSSDSKQKATCIFELEQSYEKEQWKGKINNGDKINQFINNLKLVNISFVDTSKYYDEDNLLQKLGCSHFQLLPDLLHSQEHLIYEAESLI